MDCKQTKEEDTLYVEVNDSDQIPLTTWCVIFLHQFSASTNYNVIQVDTQDKSDGVNANGKSNSAMHLPTHMVSSSIKWAELPDVVKSCELPAVVDAQKLVCYTGLCTVLRRIVMTADHQYPSKNLISLLGFRQTNLKTCSEVSPWTKLCEVQAPKDVTDFMKKYSTTQHEECQVNCVPEAVQVLDEYLSQPVNIFNSVYRQQRLKKSEAAIDDINTTCQEILDGSGPCLDPAYKNEVIITDKRKYKQSWQAGRINQDCTSVNEEPSNRDDVASPMSKLSINKDTNLGLKTESTSITKSEETITVEASNVVKDMSLWENNDTTTSANTKSKLNDSNCKKSKKKSHSKKYLSKGSLPPLEHTFAEGPDLTLADLALFPCIQLFLTLADRIGCRELFSTIPFVLRWYKNMLDVPNLVATAVQCGLTVLELPMENSVDLAIGKTKQKTENQEPDFGKGTSRKAVKAGVKRELPGILGKLQSHYIQVEFDDLLHSTELDWKSFPSEVNPCKDVDEKRASNKRNQVESLVAAVMMIAKNGCKIVDFCSGGGHVGILLAYLLPECHVIMIENNEESLRRAASRVHKIGFKNVTLYQSNIDYFTAKFDIGVSLHACGVATDLVLAKCQFHQAAFVSSPCCYGGLQNTHLITYPRSQQYQTAGITCEEYCIVGHAAEQTSWNFETEHSKRGKMCMGIIDTDRASAAVERGYTVQLCSLQPTTCSPKNNLLVGWPKDGFM